MWYSWGRRSPINSIKTNIDGVLSAGLVPVLPAAKAGASFSTINIGKFQE
jgi:hypothetical protein